MGVDNAEILKCVKEKFRDKIGLSSVLQVYFISFVQTSCCTVYSLALGDLPYAKGASWNESRGCLVGTRIEMLEGIWTWANNLNTTHIFWLADVAGAGKSAVGQFSGLRVLYPNGFLTMYDGSPHVCSTLF
jgi:hypothetical protein